MGDVHASFEFLTRAVQPNSCCALLWVCQNAWNPVIQLQLEGDLDLTLDIDMYNIDLFGE